MNLILDTKILALLFVANGAPVIAKDLLQHRFKTPVDGGVRFLDGERWLGDSKTLRGLLFSVLCTSLIASLIGIGWIIGLLVGLGAMLGDMTSSFIKRRMKIPASGQAMGLDQLPEALFPLAACWGRFSLTLADVTILAALFFASEYLFSKLLLRLHIRDRPY